MVETTLTVQRMIRPRIYRALLPNGKEITAFVPPKEAERIGPLAVGAKVRARLTVEDFSSALVLEAL
jgi:hypothetical protein